jgi:1,4-alpha-glucan branching enzyme
MMESRRFDALVEARCEDPFGVLGPHQEGAEFVVRAFAPECDELLVVTGDEIVSRAERIHPAGGFVARMSRPAFSYRLRARWGSTVLTYDDPYRFGPILGELDAYLIGEGRHKELDRVLGAHVRTIDGVRGTTFTVWAPNARAASVVGDFNFWDGRRAPMRKRLECGVFEIFLPGVEPGAAYKFRLIANDGRELTLRRDPFAFATELRPATASIVFDSRYAWQDEAWMADGRTRMFALDAPIAIYEAHLGSWKRHADGTWLTYRELAETLVPYVADRGFTHIELMPVAEHPFDGSWGYQPLGLFAPTSRFGTPDDFRFFVDRAHQAGIGVIVDWVPGHFPNDDGGLATFDGTALYEHADPRLGKHEEWGTLVFNYGRNEVANFLEVNATFWLREYHIDGLRVDAVSSMIYLDYSRNHGEWIPNVYGGNENLDATAFLRRVNEAAYAFSPEIATIAEESTAFPAVSRPTYLGGLGFGYKWNMGWMHDTLEHFSRDPLYRPYHTEEITFGLVYAFSENFVLPLSHDEVVYGKGSLLTRMPGEGRTEFANLRLLLALMYAHPGKKLLFMGAEFGARKEWNHDGELAWDEAAAEAHRGVTALIDDLNRTYRGVPALYERDTRADGFAWIDYNDTIGGIIAFERIGENDAVAVAVANFSGANRTQYRIGVSRPGAYRLALNSDDARYWGNGFAQSRTVYAQEQPAHGRPYSLDLDLPAFAMVLFVPENA